MSIQVEQQGDVCVLRVTGELRLGPATAELETLSRALIVRGERFFVLDLLGSRWIDSSGIGEVVAFHQLARTQRGVVKLVMRERTYTQFTICQLERMFDIFDDVDAAVRSFAEPGGGYRDKFA